jgi:hypothetical protein
VKKITAGRPSGKNNVTPDLLKQLEDKPEMVRLTLDIPVDLHTRLRVYAAKNRKSLVAAVRDWLSGLPVEQ